MVIGGLVWLGVCGKTCYFGEFQTNRDGRVIGMRSGLHKSRGTVNLDVIRGCDTIVGSAKFFTDELSLFATLSVSGDGNDAISRDEDSLTHDKFMISTKYSHSSDTILMYSCLLDLQLIINRLLKF